MLTPPCVRPWAHRAFTLIELMVVVAIIALLATVAVPSYMRYVRRTHSIEALMNLQKMTNGVQAYFVTERASSSGGILPKQFPYINAGNGVHPPTWWRCQYGNIKAPPAMWRFAASSPEATAFYQAINFSIDEPFLFSTGGGFYMQQAVGAAATKTVVGDFMNLVTSADLDCNGAASSIYRRLTVDANYALSASHLVEVNPLE